MYFQLTHYGHIYNRMLKGPDLNQSARVAANLAPPFLAHCRPFALLPPKPL
jgi:hypothetical protein